MGRIVAKLTSNAQIVKSDGCPLHSWCEISTQPAVVGVGGQSPDSPVLRIIHRDRSWLSPLHVNGAQTPDAEKGGIPGPWPRGLLRISYAAWRSTPGPWAPGFILRQCLVFGLFSVVGKDPLYLALIPSVWKYVQRMQFKAGALGDLGVVAPVEFGQGSSLIKPRELVASFKEPRLSSIQLILEQCREGLKEG